MMPSRRRGKINSRRGRTTKVLCNGASLRIKDDLHREYGGEDIMDMLETIRDLSILGTALAAIYGIGSWRRESMAKKKTELAEDTLTLFYEAEDAIKIIRYPGSYGGQGSTRKPGLNENLKQKHARDAAYVLIDRYLKFKKLFNRIHSMRHRFAAQFGKESAEPFDELHKLIKGILSSAMRLSEIWAKDEEGIPQEEMEKYYCLRERYEAIFWEGSEDDDVNKIVKSIVTKIENTCSFPIPFKVRAYSFIKSAPGKLRNLRHTLGSHVRGRYGRVGARFAINKRVITTSKSRML
jgi:hypothetical protein